MMAHAKKANAAPEGTAPAEGGEILHWRRDMWPPALPRVRSPRRSGGSAEGKPLAQSVAARTRPSRALAHGALGDRRDPRDDALGLALHLAARGLHLLLDLAAVLLHRTHGLRATLT